MTDPATCPAPATTTTRVEWRVESETTEDDFGTDEARARDWLTECQRHVAAGTPHWKPAVLLSRTVTITESAWQPVAVPVTKRPSNAKKGRASNPKPTTSSRPADPYPYRWVACSMIEFGPVGQHRHLARKGALTTYCGHDATHPDIWRANTRKPKCPRCDAAASRLLPPRPRSSK